MVMDIERIVLVDSLGQPIGEAPKLASHHASTPLHLAFSTYIFNANSQLLVTKRAQSKKVWPGVWTNSCCGHPFPGESMNAAIERRLAYELGMTASTITEIIPNYTYITPPYQGIIEHEWCPVYAGYASSDPVPHADEVMDWKWIDWAEYQTQLLEDTGNTWSWWCKDQLKHLLEAQSFNKYIAKV